MLVMILLHPIAGFWSSLGIIGLSYSTQGLVKLMQTFRHVSAIVIMGDVGISGAELVGATQLSSGIFLARHR